MRCLFSFFQNSGSLGCLESKREKNCFKILVFQVFRGGGKKWPIITNFRLPHSISRELWITSSRFLIHSCKMIYLGVFLYFLEKIQHFKYLNSYNFYWSTLTVFWKNNCFSSSSVNAKQKFWGVLHLLYMCNFLLDIYFYFWYMSMTYQMTLKANVRNLLMARLYFP